MDETRVRKEDVISYVRKAMDISAVEDAVMIGDREHDIFGARKNKMDAIGVLFGYGSRQELEAAGEERIAASIGELERMLL